MTTLFQTFSDLKGRRVTVLGAGRTGIAVSRFLSRCGAQVLLSENGPGTIPAGSLPRAVRTESGRHSPQVFAADLIIASPGIPNEAAVLRRARKKGIPVCDEIELMSLVLDPKSTVAVTGTNGKTTTATLISFIMRRAGRPVVTAGNIGLPVSRYALAGRARPVVLELSSYQLERQQSFHPHIALVMNLTPDHLARHGSMNAYRRAKERIFRNQTGRDYTILNYEDRHCRRMARSCPGTVVYFSSRRRLHKGIFRDSRGWHFAVGKKRFMIAPRWRLPGEHNVENGLAAAAACALSGISPRRIADGLASFRGVEHRLERVARIQGVTYINDSKSTNVESTMVALRSFGGPVWLIMGGRHKGSSYRPVRKYLKRSVEAVVLIGESATLIARDLAGYVRLIRCGTMAKAVRYCRLHAKPGSRVLLSPACASFDQYRDFEQRGNDFKRLVRARR